MKVLTFLLAQAERNPNKTAIMTRRGPVTFGALRSGVAAVLESLRQQSVGRGARVVIVADHDEWLVTFYLAASAMGLEVIIPYDLKDAAIPEILEIIGASKPAAVVVLKNAPSLTASLRENSAARVIVVDPAGLTGPDGVGPIVVDAPDAVPRYLAIFTSGTTGNPKAISISEECVVTRTLDVARAMRIDAESRVLLSGLLNSTTGILLAFVGLATGATLVMPPAGGVDALGPHIESHRLTHIMLQPLFLRQFLDDPRTSQSDLSSLRLVAYGAAPMPATVLARGRSLIKARWLQGYGLSETFGPFAWLSEEDHQSGGVDDRVGRIGDTLEVAVLGAEGEPLRPGEVGQIAVRGGTLMQGYCDFEAGRISPIDGWFITGDMGTLSSDGMLRLKGRASEFIKTMDGYKIFPSEVESWLYKLPKIREVAVVGRTFDEEVGEEPIACLYTSEPDRNASLWIDRVSAALEGVLSSEKWPRWIYLTDLPLPKNRNGKIAKRALGTALNKGELVQLKQPAGL